MESEALTFPDQERCWRGWMRAAQDGDAEAYKTLLGELLPYLRGFVRRRLGDVEALEDVVQNVLLSVHRARHSYRPERPFVPWLNAIARNAVIDQLRVRKRRLPREISLEDDGVAEPEAAPEPRTIDGGLSSELASALEALPSAQRQAVELLHLQGLSVAEAASRLGVTQGALKARAHRGYRALRARLEAER